MPVFFLGRTVFAMRLIVPKGRCLSLTEKCLHFFVGKGKEAAERGTPKRGAFRGEFQVRSRTAFLILLVRYALPTVEIISALILLSFLRLDSIFRWKQTNFQQILHPLSLS